MILAGASELVDVQGEAKLLVKNDPKVLNRILKASVWEGSGDR